MPDGRGGVGGAGNNLLSLYRRKNGAPRENPAALQAGVRILRSLFGGSGDPGKDFKQRSKMTM